MLVAASWLRLLRMPIETSFVAGKSRLCSGHLLDGAIGSSSGVMILADSQPSSHLY